jgi:hypothetical protein
VNGTLTGNASTATKLNSTRAFALTGLVTGTVNSDLASGASIATTIANGAVGPAQLSGAQSGTAPVYGCRAFVNFNGEKNASGAVSNANDGRLILASGNVASVTKFGTGLYEITLQTPMGDTNYCVLATSGFIATGDGWLIYEVINNRTASIFRLQTSSTSGAGNSPTVSVAVFK